jgi:OPA family glycerol-3-phosphate transporter-like MFS transporter
MLDKQSLLTKAQFGDIDAVGAYVYGIAFLINGPLTDRWGGRVTILIAAAGSALMNVGMAIVMSRGGDLKTPLLILNAANMYFQSFGAVSIVKVNAPWFHVRERGVLGGLFGILISLGLYFSYDWTLLLAKHISFTSVFYVPAAVLVVCFLVAFAMIRDSPAKAGFADFDTGDASSGQVGTLTAVQVAKKMFSQRVIWIIVAIEFCSGFLRQAVMKWFRPYARAIGDADGFVYQNWGMLLCIAGILGGVFAGFISDHIFSSRRGPVASVLYGGLLLGGIAATFLLGSPAIGWAVVFMSLCVIGVHGMLSGTASMDFGGTKNAGIVTGIIDGFVYLGTGTQALIYGNILPKDAAAKDPANWTAWPVTMLPVAVVGLGLCLLVWNARPSKTAAAVKTPEKMSA